MTKNRATSYTDFYKRANTIAGNNTPASGGGSKPQPGRGVPTPVRGGPPARPGADDMDENELKKAALKRRLAKTAKAMKIKSMKKRTTPTYKDA